MGKDISVAGIFDEKDKRYAEAAEFRKYYEENPDVHEVVQYALGLEGLTRQWGVHACAVIMSSHTLTDIIPIMKRPQDGAIITQFDYPTCEGLGLLKMDFLGLRNLTVISDALENIKLNGKQDPDLDHVPLDDPATYELLGRGDTLGVFQLDGGGMRDLLKLMKPDNFEDISAVGALYRRKFAHKLRAAQEWAPGDHSDPPRTRRAFEGHSGDDLRSDCLSRAGHADCPETSGLFSWPSRYLA